MSVFRKIFEISLTLKESIHVIFDVDQRKLYPFGIDAKVNMKNLHDLQLGSLCTLSKKTEKCDFGSSRELWGCQEDVRIFLTLKMNLSLKIDSCIHI